MLRDIKAFFSTSAGKGTAWVWLAALLIVVPQALSFLVAAVALTFGVHNLRESFRKVEAGVNGGGTMPPPPGDPPVPPVAIRTEGSRACDVDAVLAAMAANTAAVQASPSVLNL